MVSKRKRLPGGLRRRRSARPAEAAGVRDPGWAQPIAGSRNLFRVMPNLYRSAHAVTEDLPLLRQLGVRTVISFRFFHADPPALAAAGIRLVRVPMNTWRIGDPAVHRALREIEAAQARGVVLIHCQHGADRTGLMTAMVRMVHQGRSRAEAIDELVNGGYGFHRIWGNIVRYLEQVDIASMKRYAAA
jgi:protein tyrosine/serine phosphatase